MSGWRGWWWAPNRTRAAVTNMAHWRARPFVKAADLAALVQLYERGGRPLLKLDVDGQRRPSLRRLAARLNRAGIDVYWLVERPSPSGRGWHRWVSIAQRVTPVGIVALQAICGSDPLREAYCFGRAVRVQSGQVSKWWSTRWNVLYRKP